MNDRPTAAELLEAVRQFLSDEVVPALEGHLKYQARVAANVVAIVAREHAAVAWQLSGEWQRLDELLGEGGSLPPGLDTQRAQIEAMTTSLSARIRAGEADAGPFRDAVFTHLRQTVADKLEVALGDKASRAG